MPPSPFVAKKPISVWNRPLKADVKGVFGALSRAAVYGATGQVVETGTSLSEAAEALGIQGKEPDELAWLLIRRSLLAAMLDLIREASVAGDIEKKETEKLAGELDGALEAQEIFVDRSLFEKPGGLPFLEELKAPFTQWLEAVGQDRAAAESIAGRLPSYFVHALHAEWRRDSALYDPIREAVDTPFTRAAEREMSWGRYAARLSRQLDEPMFGEAFSLRQVYVPLRAFWVEEPTKDRSRDRLDLQQQESPRRVAVDLGAAIDEWLEKGTKDDGYRVISGGPGSGKSSFAKIYAAKVAAAGKLRVLFVPLHQFNISGSVASSLGEFVRFGEVLLENPLDPEHAEDRLLIVFDGLDELALQGRFASDAARDFLREVQREIERRNQQKRRLSVLFTGREPVVQASESELRDRERILHALPYLTGFNKGDKTWKSGAELLGIDQRHAWWQLYGKASGRSFTGLPKELRRQDLTDITSQPLLNYLVALSYNRGQLDFSKEVNLNAIYEDLLVGVHKRDYDPGRSHRALQGLDEKQFALVLEEIALAAWHGNGRTTTVEEIQKHCAAAGLSPLLERFSEGAQTGVTRVLTAFYFRQYGKDALGQKTFEFTHKSFREYLTALRIIRAVERMEEELRRREELFSGWDEREALKHWAEVCGPTAMDSELFKFVLNEVRRTEPEKAARWQALLCRLISAMLRTGMPMELLAPRPVYQEEDRQARNAEEALLAALNSCAQITGQISQISWPKMEETSGQSNPKAGTWISKLRGQRTGPGNRLALQALSHLDLSFCCLDTCDLYGARLVGSDLRRVDAHFSILSKAELGDARLERANLFRASLVEAYLEGANLEGANLEGANLEGAHLEGAHLEGAHLAGANLEGAHLEGAHLAGANLEGAVFSTPEQLKEATGAYQGEPRFSKPSAPPPPPR
jgi:hypothetical protein